MAPVGELGLCRRRDAVRLQVRRRHHLSWNGRGRGLQGRLLPAARPRRGRALLRTPRRRPPGAGAAGDVV
eukprot:15462414-Alexandrium_andersonii.AAC.1